MLRKNVAGQFLYFAGVNATTGAALTGATFSVRRAIDGTFAAGGGTITEDTGLGLYKCALSQADTNGNDLAFFFTATNAVPVCINALTTAADPSDTVRLGLTALPNVASGSAGAIITSGTGTAQLSVTSGRALSDVDTIKTNPVVNAGTVTFPTTATLASTTNITAGTITTATNVTTVNGLAANVITAAATAADFGAEMATAIWTDTTAGDFTVAASVGKSVMNGVALGTGLTVAAVSGAVGSVTGLTAATVHSDLDDIQARLPAALTAGGNMKSDALAISGDTIAADNAEAFFDGTGYAGTNNVIPTVTTTINLTTNNDKSGYAIGAAGIGASAFAAGAIDASAIAADAIGASELAQGAAQEIADEVLNRDLVGGSSGNTRNVRNALRSLRNKAAISAGTLTVYQEDDTTSAWTATVATTAGDPISSIDPA